MLAHVMFGVYRYNSVPSVKMSSVRGDGNNVKIF